MSILAPIGGFPGPGTVRSASSRLIFRSGVISGWLSQGKAIDGAKSRDPGNTGSIDVLRAGLLMGKVTSTGEYAPAVLGVTTGALASAGTTVSVGAAVVTELVRRIGSSGTFKLTGPPTAAGTVRTVTVTYSAASGTSITITAVGVNEVQTVTFGAAATGGSMVLRVPKANGEFVDTGTITWDGTDATWLSNINTALDAATGVTGGIVATGASPDTTLIFTFSGTGYAALPQPTQMISVETKPTSVTTVSWVRTTTGVDGRFIAGSFVGDVDGSHTPTTFIPDGYGVKMTELDGSTSQDQQYSLLPTAGEITTANFLPAWPSDTSLQTWLMASLSNASGGKFVFDAAY